MIVFAKIPPSLVLDRVLNTTPLVLMPLVFSAEYTCNSCKNNFNKTSSDFIIHYFRILSKGILNGPIFALIDVFPISVFQLDRLSVYQWHSLSNFSNSDKKCPWSNEWICLKPFSKTNILIKHHSSFMLYLTWNNTLIYHGAIFI